MRGIEGIRSSVHGLLDLMTERSFRVGSTGRPCAHSKVETHDDVFGLDTFMDDRAESFVVFGDIGAQEEPLLTQPSVMLPPNSRATSSR